MRLLRDREQGEVVKDKEEYLEALLDTLQDRLEVMSYQRTKKDKTALYEALSDAHELYNTLVTQCLQATTELATKARYEKAQKVAKTRAETLGGYFNGVHKA
jgi:Skp family chaperone for outer membrane proteins